MNVVTSHKKYNVLQACEGGKGGEEGRQGRMQDDVFHCDHCFTKSQEIIEWHVCLLGRMGYLQNSLLIDTVPQSRHQSEGGGDI